MNEPFKCPYDFCEYYLDRPICHNHSHVYCEEFIIIYDRQKTDRYISDSKRDDRSET